jgi:hypothetical protein
MSTLKVNKLRDTAGSADAITLDPNGGAVLAGVTTVTSVKVGAAVTISESGIEASGIGITCANINGTQIGGRRNLIINGAMQVAQRGTVTSITSSTYAGPDRFRFGIASHGTFTVSQDSSAPTGSGFANSLKLDCTAADTSVASGTAGYFQHKLEGQDCQRIKKGTSSAEQLAVQFWVKSNKTGTYALQCQDNDNSRNFTTTYSISSADTWEKKTITIPADTTGALDDDNAVSLTFNFWLVAGTNYTSGSASDTWYGNTATNMAKGHTVNIADSTSNTWYMTGFQVEIGSQATAFEHRTYGEELSLCQRYYQGATSVGAGYGSADGYARGGSVYSVTMRTSPTLTLTNTGSGSIIASGTSASGFYVTYGSLGGSSAGIFTFAADAEL